MKKLALFLAVLLLLPAVAPADSFLAPDAKLPLPEEYAQLMDSTTNYENRVFGYSLDIPSVFYLLTEEELQQLMDVGSASDVHDMRYFVSSEYMLSFEVQVKVPSFGSFQEECDNAASYIDILKNVGYDKPFMIHDGVVRETQLGSMLEIAYGYQVNGTNVNVVYYDYYLGANEYIFYLEGYETAYDILQPLLAQIVRTVNVAEAPVML